MEPPATRPSLLLRVRDPADVESWRQFEAAYGDLIVRYCRRRGLQLADAEDVRQVVLSKLSRALRRFDYDPARGRFRDYLGRCVRNTLVTEIARHKSPPTTVSLHEGADVAPPSADEGDPVWQEEWVQHHYRRALRTLRLTCDPQTLNVFEALVQGRSADELGPEFGITSAAVRKIKQRMRDRLQDLILRQIHDEEFPNGKNRAE